MAVWVINNQRLFSIVEDPDLVELLKYLNSTAKHVKADSIKRTIMGFYDEGKLFQTLNFKVLTLNFPTHRLK